MYIDDAGGSPVERGEREGHGGKAKGGISNEVKRCRVCVQKTIL
jgi:hypothetical protein